MLSEIEYFKQKLAGNFEGDFKELKPFLEKDGYLKHFRTTRSKGGLRRWRFFVLKEFSYKGKISKPPNYFSITVIVK